MLAQAVTRIWIEPLRHPDGLPRYNSRGQLYRTRLGGPAGDVLCVRRGGRDDQRLRSQGTNRLGEYERFAADQRRRGRGFACISPSDLRQAGPWFFGRRDSVGAWLISVRASVRGYPQPSAPNLLVSSGGASVQAAPMPLPANLGSMDKSRAVRVCAKHVLLTVIAR